MITDSFAFDADTDLEAQYESNPGSSEDNPIVTDGGRKIWRHPNGKGCVIEYDYWGTPSKLFVADAFYRGAANYGSSSTDYGLPKIEVSRSFFSDVSVYVPPRPSNDATLPRDNQQKPLPYSRNDAWIQKNYASLKNDGTAASNTERLIAFSDTVNAQLCRSVGLPDIGQCDQPNLYQVIMLYLESDNIDSLDPTVKNNSNFALGHKNPRGRFGLTGFYMYDFIVSSTERDSLFAWNVAADGRCSEGESTMNSYTTKSDIGGCVPVKEL